jgi:H-type lectin domain-containing protein
MKRLSNPRTGIQQGEIELFADFRDGGEMWTGTGARERRKAILFDEAFSSVPVAQVAISLWDMDTSAAIRAELVAEKVTREGFDIVFRTWSDSRIARVRVVWTVIGELSFEDDWDVK